MEHNPLDMPARYEFHLAMADRAMVLKKGNLQPNVALMARFPPEANDSGWVVKQALDMGLHGVFNGVDTPEQACLAVGYMRYPPRRDSRYQQPRGVRGSGPGTPPGSGESRLRNTSATQISGRSIPTATCWPP